MTEPEGLAAALLQLSAHAEKLSALDHREAGHAAEAGGRIAALTTLANAMNGTLTGQAEILAGLAGLDEQVAGLAARLDEIAPADDGDLAAYQPSASPRFWKLGGQARQDAITKLRAWVEQIYLPCYGHLSAALGGCWEQHPLCLYTLDWLSELWSVLYLQPRRTTGTLAGQAEWQTRLLTAAADPAQPRPAPARTAAAGDLSHLAGWVEHLQEGNRNAGLYWAACRAAEAGQPAVLDDLARAAAGIGLTDREIARTISSARRRGQRPCEHQAQREAAP